ncbi:60S ribosomal protein L10a-like [Bicyclus anynana]|uniref:Ribosomal protein n=1 Tax=Bicyclus anynana TaxID=110368 RepID=A0A6J1NQT8_BICAN|nr:60S ribosomal protein L10a-like [Bicyclus anynana]
MSTFVSQERLTQAIDAVVREAGERNPGGDPEKVEMQIVLKTPDVLDKRPLKVCVLGDQQHCEEARGLDVPCMDVEALEKLNKSCKLVKKLAKKYDAFLASESIIKQIPRLLGPGLNKAGKFPSPLSHQESLSQKIEEMNAGVKCEPQRELRVSLLVGRSDMDADELTRSMCESVVNLQALLKRECRDVRPLQMQAQSGTPQRLY